MGKLHLYILNLPVHSYNIHLSGGEVAVKKPKKKKSESIDQTIITSISGVVGKKKPKRGYLFFLAGPLLGKFFPLQEGTTIIGRSPNADIAINDSRVSRKHLEVTVDRENVKIKDLGSTNGTFVNGEKISIYKLKADDKIQISPASIFKFSLADEDEKVAINELYELGVIDPLTNVYNKRYFIDRLKEEFSHSKRLKIPLSLMMIDIDFFKKINDTYGHLAGDHVLTKLAKIFQAMTRHEDIVARYGGEEFVIILRSTGEEGTHLLAERIRSAVQGTSVNFDGNEIKLSISVGIATQSEKVIFDDPEKFIAEADRCLYYSKEHGRNRTTIASQIE